MNKFTINEAVLIDQMFHNQIKALRELGAHKVADERLALRNKLMNSIETEE